jgi:hypothetical protein
MTELEIKECIITQCIFIDNKFNILVELENNKYGFLIDAKSDVTKEELRDLLFKELLLVDKILSIEIPSLVEFTDLIGLAPINIDIKK